MLLYHAFIPKPLEYRLTFRHYHKPENHWLTTPEGVRIPLLASKKSRHNVAGFRWDFWFQFPGSKIIWHGVSIGDTCLVRCKQTKRERD